MRRSVGVIVVTACTLGALSPHRARSEGEILDLLQQGRFKEAETLAAKASEASLRVHGRNHTKTATCLGCLGLACQAQQKLPQAERLFLEAIAINDRCFGPVNSHSATWHNNLSGLYIKETKYAQAEHHAKKALAGMEGAYGPHHFNVALSLHHLGQAYEAQGRLDAAVLAFRRSLPILEREHRGNNIAASVRSRLEKIDPAGDEKIGQVPIVVGNRSESPDNVPTARELFASADRALRSAVESGLDTDSDGSTHSPSRPGAGIDGAAAQRGLGERPNQTNRITRREFKQKVQWGMTKEQVKQMVGKPDRTQEEGGQAFWYYDGVVDEESENPGDAQVVFTNGTKPIVHEVNFY